MFSEIAQNRNTMVRRMIPEKARRPKNPNRHPPLILRPQLRRLLLCRQQTSLQRLFPVRLHQVMY